MLDEDDADHAQDWVTFWELLGGKGPVAPAVDDDAAVCDVAFVSLAMHHLDTISMRNTLCALQDMAPRCCLQP